MELNKSRKILKSWRRIRRPFVYGHVDTTAKIKYLKKINGSYKITFSINDEFIKYFAPKGSVTIDGVSLTVNEVDKDFFTVNIVTFTWSNTSFQNYEVGTIVNIEFDILVRYLESLNANK